MLLNLHIDFIFNIVKDVVFQRFHERVEIIEILHATVFAEDSSVEVVKNQLIEDTEEGIKTTALDPFIINLEADSEINISNIHEKLRRHNILSGLILGFVVTMSLFTILGIIVVVLLVNGHTSSVISETSNNPDTLGIPIKTSSSTNTTVIVVDVFSKESLKNNTTVSISTPYTDTTKLSIVPLSSSTIIPEPSNISNIRHRYFVPLPKHIVKVKSYQEYIESMTNIPPNHEVHVSIFVQSPFDWPNGGYNVLPNSTEIIKLFVAGLLAVDDLIDILSQCPNVEHLHLINTDDKLCQRNQGQLNVVKQINKKAYLPLLRHLVLRDLSRCTEIYETLALYMGPLTSLKRLTLYRFLLDDHNHIPLQEFLGVQSKYIKELGITEMRIVITKPFLEASSKVILMQNVEKIRLDSNMSAAHENEIRIGRNFPKIFPDLRVFYSKYGYIKWNKFSNLVGCKKLNVLTVGIEVSVNRTYFDVSFLQERLPFLTKTVLILKFKMCSVPGLNTLGKNDLSGWETVNEPLVVVVFRSNCKIYANTISALRHDTEEKYDGSYVFTYKILKDTLSWNKMFLYKI